jgi:hypothetical protein
MRPVEGRGHRRRGDSLLNFGLAMESHSEAVAQAEGAGSVGAPLAEEGGEGNDQPRDGKRLHEAEPGDHGGTRPSPQVGANEDVEPEHVEPQGGRDEPERGCHQRLDDQRHRGMARAAADEQDDDEGHAQCDEEQPRQP